MKSRIIIIALISSIVVSCTEAPSVKTLENYNFYYDNPQGTRLSAGEPMAVSMRFQIHTNTSAPVDSVRVLFEPVIGGGTVTETTGYVVSGESTQTIWTMGSEYYAQILRASIFDLSGSFVTSVDLIAYGFREDEWDEVKSGPEVGVTAMAADTVNDVTFMIAFNKLYRQGSRYYTWDEVTDPVFQSPNTPREVEIDRNGVFYVSTSGGVVYRSADHGDSWEACSKPWPERSHYLHLHVSNDNRLWIYTSGEPGKYSDDGGTTWHNAGSEMTAHGVADIFRLKNGSLIMHGLDCCSLMISYDDGQSWRKVNTPDYTQKLYVSPEDEIFICADVGLTETIYSTKDPDAGFRYVHSVGPSFRTSMDNIFNKWGNFHYVAIPGYGIMKSYDLKSYEDYWVNRDLVNIFIDHNGVLLVKDIDYQTVYYRKNSQ